MDLYIIKNAGDFAWLLSLFVIVHQAIIDLYKIVLRPRTRRYSEALAYIVYGPELGREESEKTLKAVIQNIPKVTEGFPTTVGRKFREHPGAGAQERLIKSFLLRGVGDSPLTDVSDIDVKNIIEISRSAQEDKAIARTSRMLDDFIRGGSQPVADFKTQVDDIIQHSANAALTQLLEKWKRQSANAQTISSITLAFWRNEFNEKFFPPAVRAEQELANSLKAAEFQYVHGLSRVSMWLAGVEAFLIVYIFFFYPPAALQYLVLNMVLALFFAFATLLIVPRGTKSLIDMLVGLGQRLRS